MKKLLLFLFIFLPILLVAQNGKKIYADYHGVRYTRQYDGELGRWEYYSNTEKSKSGIKSLCYNADLIDDEGRHQIAAVAYPQTGIQSNRDPEFLEYQILSAKTAKIDGFFIEWGFKPHENDELLRNMQKVAAKYDFEIGVTWCDGWLYYDWITKLYPEINNREKKTEYMAKMYQYLVDSVFTGPTAPIVKGMPVFYHFQGATPDEYKKVLETVQIPASMKQPVALRRWPNRAKLDAAGKYVPFTYSEEMERWKELGEVPTPWLPTRIRRDYPGFDVYASQEDVIEYMKPFRDSIWNSSRHYAIKSGFAMPGMDNRGCAGWGHSTFCYMPRNDGKTYEEMWKFCMAEKDSLDMMFIASWSDYTEGHEIEPTIENGDRELRTTLKYASEFKKEQADERGLPLPLLLFQLRKESHFLRGCKMDVTDFNRSLDKVAMLISEGRYAIATGLLLQLKKDAETARAALKVEMVRLRESEMNIQGKKESKGYNAGESLSVSLPKPLVSKLQANNYTGYLYFEYLDKGNETLFVRSSTQREPKGKFSTVARMRTDNTGEWKKAKIELYKENIVYGFNKPSFFIKGNVAIRNLSVGYSIYTVK
ncbi:glycoside hydrolase family 71/99-like protein [uncultured Bacteroides sp.]|uniref:glycoside hydrolase family 71/99-like protein n=1 Tax=uncultured Bacteroides sp. TaxID=162156 RepID=UPI0025DE8178|nr:glycoside hydrolase family 71/99-like protein [uncultured Bacteroides sp.]